MARIVKAGKSTKPTNARDGGRSMSAIKDRKPERMAKAGGAPLRKTKAQVPAAPPASKASPATKVSPAPKVSPATKVSPAPKVSKDELRAHVEKLEQLVASLRAKSREANKTAKAAAARIVELETQVEELEKTLAAAPPPVQEPKPAKPARAKRRSREIDPGDAVPPGVAVEEPAPLDDEAETALENLDSHLSHE